jgi:hypothetical protein
MASHIYDFRSLRSMGSFRFAAALLIALLAIVDVTYLVASQARVWWDAIEARLSRISDLNQAVVGPFLSVILSFSDVPILLAALVVFILAVPSAGSGPRLDRSRRSVQQQLLQFRIRTILLVTTAVAVVCAIARGFSLNPLLVIVGALYACGPWTALLVGNATRIWYPASERKATTAALALLAFIGVGYAIASSAIQHPFAIHWRDLLWITTVIWSPQVILYLSLRRLLLPEYADRITSVT